MRTDGKYVGLARREGLTGNDLGHSGKTYPGVKAAYARIDWEKLW
jgi:hypothetical protein